MQQQIENYLNFLEAGMDQEPNTPATLMYSSPASSVRSMTNTVAPVIFGALGAVENVAQYVAPMAQNGGSQQGLIAPVSSLVSSAPMSIAAQAAQIAQQVIEYVTPERVLPYRQGIESPRYAPASPQPPVAQVMQAIAENVSPPRPLRLINDFNAALSTPARSFSMQDDSPMSNYTVRTPSIRSRSNERR